MAFAMQLLLLLGTLIAVKAGSPLWNMADRRSSLQYAADGSNRRSNATSRGHYNRTRSNNYRQDATGTGSGPYNGISSNTYRRRPATNHLSSFGSTYGTSKSVSEMYLTNIEKYMRRMKEARNTPYARCYTYDFGKGYKKGIELAFKQVKSNDAAVRKRKAQLLQQFEKVKNGHNPDRVLPLDCYKNDIKYLNMSMESMSQILNISHDPMSTAKMMLNNTRRQYERLVKTNYPNEENMNHWKEKIDGFQQEIADIEQEMCSKIERKTGGKSSSSLRNVWMKRRVARLRDELDEKERQLTKSKTTIERYQRQMDRMKKQALTQDLLCTGSWRRENGEEKLVYTCSKATPMLLREKLGNKERTSSGASTSGYPSYASAGEHPSPYKSP